MDSEVKTRVTPFQDLPSSATRGQDCLVIIYSSDPHELGRRQPLDAGPVSLGRGSENVIVLAKDSVSRRHARIEKRAHQYYIMDLRSTNGTYVNDEPVEEAELKRGDQIKVGDTIFKFLSGSDLEAQYHETIYRMTIVDGLTGVYNKRYLMETLGKEISRARRHGRPLSLVMFDIDHFKQVNDTYGHLAGDHVLKEVAQLALSRLRPDDVVARYGGEEFAVVLPETKRAGAGHIAELLREKIAEAAFEFEGEAMRVTVSLGVAQLRSNAELNEFIGEADAQMFRAKKAGRDRVCSG